MENNNSYTRTLRLRGNALVEAGLFPGDIISIEYIYEEDTIDGCYTIECFKKDYDGKLYPFPYNKISPKGRLLIANHLRKRHYTLF